jgi:DNA (cytosine-5)-methyltransferase 1
VHRVGRSRRTLARIEAGRRQHGMRFVAPYYGSGSGESGRSLARPLGTITTRDRWAVIDGDRMRMVSVEEARRAMAFRDSYRLPANGREAMHMLGNAVPPLAAQRVIEALRAAA